jgi:cell division protein FtsB
MSWFKKKSDPITERARSLSSEIAALEAQIKHLDSQLQRGAGQPRVRSTALPHGAAIPHATMPTTATAAHAAPVTAREPIFEDLDQRELKSHTTAPATPEHFNEMGVRKYDVTEVVSRVKEYFRGAPPMNPRLISYLAAGGIQGLQPLRREKRVARNRFIALTLILFLILVGIIFMFARTR